MSLSEKLEKLRSPGRSGSDTKTIKQPEDWRPRMDIDTVRGGFVVGSPRPEHEVVDATTVLAEFGLNPAEWNVTSLRREVTFHSGRIWIKPRRVECNFT